MGAVSDTRTSLLERLTVELPALRMLREVADMEAFRFDETAYLRAGRPLAVCFPRSTSDVQTIVRLACTVGVPIVARGAGTGLSGGAVAVDDALTVVFTEMNAIVEIDPANLTATVQPGVVNADLNRAVGEFGLLYPPDPASFETCTIGGNLAENSGGLRCVKYGVTRDWVLGLEVVLADGSVIRTGGKTIKDVAGYDLTGLFVGSEGTLGLITEAIVRLLPLPPPKLTLIAFFASVRQAGQAVAGIIAAGVVPVTLELMDAFTIAAVDDAYRLGLDRRAGALLMVESDLGGAAAETEMNTAEAACVAAGCDVGDPRGEHAGGRLAAPGPPRRARLARARRGRAHGRHRRAAQPHRRDARADRASSHATRAYASACSVTRATATCTRPTSWRATIQPQRRASTRRATRSTVPRWSWAAR